MKSWSSILFCVLIFPVFAQAAGEPSPIGKSVPPRSDGAVLHVDFENYQDNYIGLLNGGVRNLGYPFTETKIKEVAVINDPKVAFAGKRCGYILTDEADQRGRIVFQRRYDAPNLNNDVVAELVYRPVREIPVVLEDFWLWESPCIGLYANGTAESGTWSLDVQDKTGRVKDVVRNLRQTEWVRIIMHKKNRVIDLWVGLPEEEQFIGSYQDMNPGAELGRFKVGEDSESAVRGSGYWDDIRVGKALAPNGKVAPGEVWRDVSKEKPKIQFPIKVGNEKQLFVDDVLIQSQSGLKRVLHPVRKHPNSPLIQWDKPWEQNALYVLPFTVLRDPETKKLRLWYAVYDRVAGKRTYECVAESGNGIEWGKPNLGLFDFKGSRDNNIIREGRSFRVLYDLETKDAAQRYKAIIRDAGFIAGFSPDGLRWQTTTPVLDQAYDATSAHWDPIDSKWIASCKVWYKGRRVRGYAESKNFTDWTDTYFMLDIDDRDPPQDQIYSMSINRYESVYIGMPKIYHLDTDRCDTQLAFSRNAKHWERPDRTPFIPNASQKGDHDYGNIDNPGNWIRVGDELWFYYAGRAALHNEKSDKSDGSVCLATLRQDGFMSMDAAGDDDGILVTQPVVLKGEALYVNADAKGGSIKVEILDDKQQDPTTDEVDVPLFPYLKNKTEAISADNVRQVVKWNGSENLASLNQRTVRLRFHIRKAKLYSIWTE